MICDTYDVNTFMLIYVQSTYGRTQKKFKGGKLGDWEPRVRMRLPFSILFGTFLEICFMYMYFLFRKNKHKAKRKAGQTKFLRFQCWH